MFVFVFASHVSLHKFIAELKRSSCVPFTSRHPISPCFATLSMTSNPAQIPSGGNPGHQASQPQNAPCVTCSDIPYGVGEPSTCSLCSITIHRSCKTIVKVFFGPNTRSLCPSCNFPEDKHVRRALSDDLPAGLPTNLHIALSGMAEAARRTCLEVRERNVQLRDAYLAHRAEVMDDVQGFGELFEALQQTYQQTTQRTIQRTSQQTTRQPPERTTQHTTLQPKSFEVPGSSAARAALRPMATEESLSSKGRIRPSSVLQIHSDEEDR